MSKTKNNYIVYFASSLILLFAYSNCQSRKAGDIFTSSETTIGNPAAPQWEKITNAMCTVINRCHSTVGIEECRLGLRNASGFAAPLGLDSSLDLGSAVFNAELAKVLTGNAFTGSQCTDSIESLSCEEAKVVGAYDSAASNPFANATILLSQTECEKVYAKTMNLEVPVELVDYSLASNITNTTFQRTRTNLDTSGYDGQVSYFFEAVAKNSDSQAHKVSLVDSNGNSLVDIVVPGNQSSLRSRIGFTPNSGLNNYRVLLEATPAAGDLKVTAARIIVKQIGATRTRIYIPLVNYFSDMAGSPDKDNSLAATVNQTTNGQDVTALWMKNNSAFKTIAAGNPWTLEAVMSSDGAGTAVASLYNTNKNMEVIPSQLTAMETTPTLKTVSFADQAENFDDLGTFEIRIQSTAGSAYLYRAGLWLDLNQLTATEVYYRYSRLFWKDGTSTEVEENNRVFIDNTVFSSTPIFYHQLTGTTNGNGGVCTESIIDAGLEDSGKAGTPVSGSELTISSSVRTLFRTGPLTMEVGHRYISSIAGNSSGVACLPLAATIVVEIKN